MSRVSDATWKGKFKVIESACSPFKKEKTYELECSVPGQNGQFASFYAVKSFGKRSVRNVGLKLFNPRESAYRNARREFDTLKQLVNEGVVPAVYAFGSVDELMPEERYGILEEQIDGLDLRGVYAALSANREGSIVDPAKTVELGYQLTAAVASLFQFDEKRVPERIVHRDLGGGNLRFVLNEDGSVERVVVIDFGQSTLDGNPELTPDGIRRHANPRYGAPEMFSDDPERNETKVDVWSIGAILFEARTGSVPFWENVRTLCEQYDAGGIDSKDYITKIREAKEERAFLPIDESYYRRFGDYRDQQRRCDEFLEEIIYECTAPARDRPNIMKLYEKFKRFREQMKGGHEETLVHWPVRSSCRLEEERGSRTASKSDEVRKGDSTLETPSEADAVGDRTLQTPSDKTPLFPTVGGDAFPDKKKDGGVPQHVEATLRSPRLLDANAVARRLIDGAKNLAQVFFESVEDELVFDVFYYGASGMKTSRLRDLGWKVKNRSASPLLHDVGEELVDAFETDLGKTIMRIEREEQKEVGKSLPTRLIEWEELVEGSLLEKHRGSDGDLLRLLDSLTCQPSEKIYRTRHSFPHFFGDLGMPIRLRTRVRESIADQTLSEIIRHGGRAVCLAVPFDLAVILDDLFTEPSFFFDVMSEYDDDECGLLKAYAWRHDSYRIANYVDFGRSRTTAIEKIVAEAQSSFLSPEKAQEKLGKTFLTSLQKAFDATSVGFVSRVCTRKLLCVQWFQSGELDKFTKVLSSSCPSEWYEKRYVNYYSLRYDRMLFDRFAGGKSDISNAEDVAFAANGVLQGYEPPLSSTQIQHIDELMENGDLTEEEWIPPRQSRSGAALSKRH